MTADFILVVEDEVDIRELLKFTLQRAGFNVQVSADAEQALQVLQGPLPSLAVIDWMLPGISGLELARRIRQDNVTNELPIVLLTARTDEEDKLRGFGSGADDYLTKPFSTRELIARIRALLRRTGLGTNGRIKVGNIELNTFAHQVTISGTAIHLRPTEYELLKIMMRQPKRAFHRSQLLDQVWGRNVYVDARTVDVHMLRLRNALKPFDCHKLIKTVHGVGYRFDSNDTSS